MTDTSSPCIAIVDDDQALRDSLAWLLDSVGIASRLFADGEAFLADDPEGFDTVLLDVRMPGLSGLQVQQRLGELDKAPPVIFMTGHGDVPMAVSALKAGARDFLEKPFNHQQLIDIVQQSLHAHQQARQAQLRLEALRERYAALRPKERQILVHVARGLTSREVADHLEISPKTVEIYRLRAMKALGATNLAELVRLCVALGLVDALPEEAP
ncbi:MULTISPECIES: response regulator [unclassified Halomonas]|uniref:response regulator transcription factor n=1 Tax=unclassified Halomonas TaxID=2609666 RepID=UPI00288702E8|nr:MULTISPECIES: response regulator [unclassified Halomonas]MDT0501590.1 response regulator [Halomonas sp. PAR7]MDT0511053.1 response regulator [Halomonas sp. LES1]MDT0592430.1 response regulator [Halomonas sp. PAR8]